MLKHEAQYGNSNLTVPTDTYCYAKVSKGLVEDLSIEKNNTTGISWIVNRNLTTLESYSVIPAKEFNIIIKDKNGNIIPNENLIYVNKEALENRNKNFGVGMVNVENADFQSTHTLTVIFNGILNLKIKYEINASIRNVPKSLWEKRATDYAADALINNVLTGFQITPIAPVPNKSLPIDLEKFKYHLQNYTPQIIPAKPTFVSGPDNVEGMKVMKETINSEPATALRRGVIDSLITRGIKVNPVVNVSRIAEHAESFIMAPPVLRFTYWKRSA